jgi:hypothetical protein
MTMPQYLPPGSGAAELGDRQAWWFAAITGARSRRPLVKAFTWPSVRRTASFASLKKKLGVQVTSRLYVTS